MTLTVAEVRSTARLLDFIAGGGQPKYLFFWGHQPQPDGSVGKGCFSQWWPAAFTVDGVSYPTAEHYMMTATGSWSRRPPATGSGASAWARAMTWPPPPGTGAARTSSASP
jgi:hypothetical protein